MARTSLTCIPDYPVFASEDFDANDYANAILAGEPYPSQPGAPRLSKPTGIIDTAREDISVAIGKLDAGIEDVSKQIKHVVRFAPPMTVISAPDATYSAIGNRSS